MHCPRQRSRVSASLLLAWFSISACGGGGATPAPREEAPSAEAGPRQETQADDPSVAAALRLVDALAVGNFAEAAADFDETMQKVLPPEKLEATWTQVTSMVGPFRERRGSRKEPSPAGDIVRVLCIFEKAPLNTKVVVDPSGKVGGLWFEQATSAEPSPPPPYADASSFDEKEVTVGTGEWALPGTLSLPKGDGPFPGVVLVHGSGPNDRDETVGPNKPFRDLAWGLASRGIAVLRYEKRTRQHSTKLLSERTDLTVREETVDDALLGVSLLGGVERVDPERVFVLGHSLGGMLVPRIASGAPDLAGLIILAGTTRPLEEVLLMQVRYIADLDGKISKVEQEGLDKLEEEIGKIRAIDKEGPGEPGATILGAPVAYWRDLKAYDPLGAVVQVKAPLLVLQGERDYQVTMVDFENWRKALAGREDVKLKSYGPLNHLFIPGEGVCTPQEYAVAGHVSEEVVSDIALWINGL